ncbi:MAG: hypothetical protein QM537_04700, partial [Candidatus Symbiobacter sp.]|nr:hypothetical protein [Candidatus Symbiobacter sp.]
HDKKTSCQRRAIHICERRAAKQSRKIQQFHDVTGLLRGRKRPLANATFFVFKTCSDLPLGAVFHFALAFTAKAIYEGIEWQKLLSF